MKGGRYLVMRSRGYRGHSQGTTFAARLEPRAEARAIWRGDIKKIEEVTPSLQPGSYQLPAGWLQHEGGQHG